MLNWANEISSELSKQTPEWSTDGKGLNRDARVIDKALWALTSQAEEVRALSTMVTAAAAEPIKAHVTNGMEEMRKVQTERLGLPVKSSELPRPVA